MMTMTQMSGGRLEISTSLKFDSIIVVKVVLLYIYNGIWHRIEKLVNSWKQPS